MTFKDIIDANTDDDVLMDIVRLYPSEDSNLFGYRKVLGILRLLEPHQADQMELELLEMANVDFGIDYVDITGNRNGVSYAMVYKPWSEWLALTVSAGTMKQFSQLEIIAHCLCEMTIAGYDEKEIEAELKVMRGLQLP